MIRENTRHDRDNILVKPPIKDIIVGGLILRRNVQLKDNLDY